MLIKTKSKETTSNWGGELEIIALGDMLDIQIQINGHKNPITQNGQIKVLLFHVNGNHYEFGVQGKSASYFFVYVLY
jgi:hypothetical protein